MQLPQRVDKHITETSSFKIFSNNIPDHWIIREVTERDYGIDCYIELVTNNNQVTGELISVQLKGVQKIKWTKKNYYTFSSINIPTSNYWNKFPTAVFLCLVDITLKEVYYVPVKSYIKKNFSTYFQQKKFSYRIEKTNQIKITDLNEFLQSYFKEKHINSLEENLITFISHYNQYSEFMNQNIGRDLFMGVGWQRFLYLKHFYKNLEFLCSYFNIEWGIKSISEYQKESIQTFGGTSDFYEHHLTLALKELDKKLIPLLAKVKHYITEVEREYWMIMDKALFFLVWNANEENGKMHGYDE